MKHVKKLYPRQLQLFWNLIPFVSNSTEQATEEIKKLLEFCKVSRSRKEIQEFMGLSHRENFRTNILNPLIKGGLIKLTVPDKPTSPNQKYYSEIGEMNK